MQGANWRTSGLSSSVAWHFGPRQGSRSTYYERSITVFHNSKFFEHYVWNPKYLPTHSSKTCRFHSSSARILILILILYSFIVLMSFILSLRFTRNGKLTVSQNVLQGIITRISVQKHS
jgi:hypothetical protein